MSESEQTYSRGELEVALWMTFTQGDHGAKVDRTFKGRIQKLLDLDRAGNSNQTYSSFAFHDAPPPGRGQEVIFIQLDVFCLAIGLDLLDLGFKQSEVVFLLRHLRKDLADILLAIRSDPPILRTPLGQGDKRVFMMLRKVEMTETFGAGGAATQPLVLEPQFLNGAKGSAFLAELGYNDRTRIVLEIAELSVLLEQELARAPRVKRGRHS